MAARRQAAQLYALYDYTALDDDELSLARGARLTVTATDAERADDGWWDAVDADGHAGLVPNNYLGVRRQRLKRTQGEERAILPLLMHASTDPPRWSGGRQLYPLVALNGIAG
jgi:hypothetical protein